MTGPLTYPPEIVVESRIDLPPDFGNGANIEVCRELAMFMIEIVVELLGSL